MAFSTGDEYRVEALETLVNDLQIAINNLATKAQLKQLILIRQAEYDALLTRIEALESQVQVLQSSI